MLDYDWVEANIDKFTFTEDNLNAMYTANHALLDDDETGFNHAIEQLACPLIDEDGTTRLEPYTLTGWHLSAACVGLLEDCYPDSWRTVGFSTQIDQAARDLLPAWAIGPGEITRLIDAMNGRDEQDGTQALDRVVRSAIALATWACKANGLALEDVAY